MCSKVWANEGSELETLGGEGGARPVVMEEMDGSWRVDIAAAAKRQRWRRRVLEREKIARLSRLWSS